MKIAICQLEILFEQKEENIIRAESFVKEATSKGASFILFPEMSFTGFSMKTKLTGEENLETVTRIREMAKKYQITIGVGWVKHQKRSENHYAVIDSKGNILGDYTKIHPFSYAKEDDYFVGGTDTCIFDYENMCFGLSICYDLRFPEIYQQLSKKADVILVPANWPSGRAPHWNTLLRARAIENQVYVIGINCTGRQGFTRYKGGSRVINPNGDVLLDMECDEALQFIELENDVDKFREKFPTKRDRKVEIYRQFYNE